MGDDDQALRTAPAQLPLGVAGERSDAERG